VDFINLPGLEGVIITNLVNYSKVGNSKMIESKISINGGLSWKKLTAPTVDSIGNAIGCTGTCSLHIHLQADDADAGMLLPFGTDESAGIMVGVGNIGDYLSEYELGNIYLTRDGGSTWKEVKKEPHKWAFVDYGGLLVLVDDQKPINTLSYSWDFGISWADYIFSNDFIRIESIISHKGSNKILISGHTRDGYDSKTVSIYIDFSTLFERICDQQKIGGGDNDDFEQWTIDNGCVYGQKTNYIRRVAESFCSVGADFKWKKTSGTCECKDADYECDAGFSMDSSGVCNLSGADPSQPKDCKKGTKYTSSSGYKKLLFSTCAGGIDKTKQVERECGAEIKGPNNVKMDTFFFGGIVENFFYFKNTGRIMVKDSLNYVYFSQDNGSTWQRILEEAESVAAIVDDQSFPNRCFVINTKGEVWISRDAGNNFKKIYTDGVPNPSLSPEYLVPHPINEDWLIWIGTQDCQLNSQNCHTVAHVSWNYGASWEVIASYVYKCDWGYTKNFKSFEKSIFCVIFDPQSGNQRSLTKLVLKRSDQGTAQFTDISISNGFAITDDYMIVAVVNSNLF
jgi:hypothetical protein